MRGGPRRVSEHPVSTLALHDELPATAARRRRVLLCESNKLGPPQYLILSQGDGPRRPRASAVKWECQSHTLAVMRSRSIHCGV
ncbi:hypothetical protein EVAR_14905_1 [Eumeta japonica]|uniref:Uncharacterized protein n=1 Tax=Eumeta variegata TaxID=151549 RepID=A0A4C1XQ17_EUMVA|nr:hypothetical protein EVAR_14905_1 [Eumeta japonica]